MGKYDSISMAALTWIFPKEEIPFTYSPLPNRELEAQSELQKGSIEKPPQLQESQDRALTKPDAELQLPQEPVGYLDRDNSF